jgi:hypothetical protein
MMTERIAIKVMTGSDLTFFDAIFQAGTSGSNQKAINLNADVFAQVLYPDFTKHALGKSVEVPVKVSVLGPRPSKPYRFPRSITKGAKYKNWRLNGAAVPDPDDEAGKFNDLVPGDVAVLEFHGDAAPEAVTLVVIANKIDPGLHAGLSALVLGGRQTMAAVSRTRLAHVVDASGAGVAHPIRALLEDRELEAILEEVQIGAEPAVRKLRARKGRKVTKSDIEAARERFNRIGADGEALAHVLLSQMKRDGKLTDVVWTSEEDAAASWDFEVVELGGKRIRMDAKSTTRGFDGAFFLSAAETVAAADPGVPYRIIRITDLTEDGATARISEDINELAAGIVKAAAALPQGVLPTCFSLDLNAIKWGPVLAVERPDEPE